MKQSTAIRIATYMLKYPERTNWDAKNTKPWRTKLLKLVRNGISLRKATICKIEMMEITNSLSKSECPSSLPIAMSVETAKALVNTFRLEAAKSFMSHKRDKRKSSTRVEKAKATLMQEPKEMATTATPGEVDIIVV